MKKILILLFLVLLSYDSTPNENNFWCTLIGRKISASGCMVLAFIDENKNTFLKELYPQRVAGTTFDPLSINDIVLQSASMDQGFVREYIVSTDQLTINESNTFIVVPIAEPFSKDIIGLVLYSVISLPPAESLKIIHNNTKAMITTLLIETVKQKSFKFSCASATINKPCKSNKKEAINTTPQEQSKAKTKDDDILIEHSTSFFIELSKIVLPLLDKGFAGIISFSIIILSIVCSFVFIVFLALKKTFNLIKGDPKPIEVQKNNNNENVNIIARFLSEIEMIRNIVLGVEQRVILFLETTTYSKKDIYEMVLNILLRNIVAECMNNIREKRSTLITLNQIDMTDTINNFLSEMKSSFFLNIRRIVIHKGNLETLIREDVKDMFDEIKAEINGKLLVYSSIEVPKFFSSLETNIRSITRRYYDKIIKNIEDV